MYNALTIHGLAVLEQLPSSVLDVVDFWSRTCYNIGGLVFSLDDIEHGVLRGELHAARQFMRAPSPPYSGTYTISTPTCQVHRREMMVLSW